MKRIADVGSQPLVWVQAAKKREYQLLSGEEPVGSLRWDKAAEHEALAETADGIWSFRRKGFLRPTITVRARDAESDAATLEVEWTGGGRLMLGGGGEYRWGPANFWRSEWAFAKEGDRAAIRFRPDANPFKAGARVELAPDAAARAETPLLLATGWYVLVLMLEDTAIVGV